MKQDEPQTPQIHFGWFVWWGRLKMGLSRDAFVERMNAIAGKRILTSRQLARIETEPECASQGLTIVGIAKALGIEPEKFEEKWKSTPVRKPPTRSNEADIAGRIGPEEISGKKPVKRAAKKSS